MKMRCGLLRLVSFIVLSITACAPEVADVDPPFESTAGARLVALGDIDGDGWLDVVSASGESQPIQIHLRNPLTLDFDTYTVAGGAPLTAVGRIELADVDGDGALDIIILITDTGFVAPQGAQQEGAIAILFQGADPRRVADWTQVPAAGASPPDNLSLPNSTEGVSDMVVGDFDAANGPDIVVLSNEGSFSKVRLFANPGPARCRDQNAWASEVIDTDVVALGRGGAADVDHDGDADLVLSVPAARSFNLRWLANPRLQPASPGADPVPTFVRQTLDPAADATAGARAVALGDINGDGWTDIASISDESQPVQIHLRNPLLLGFDTYAIAGGAPLSRMNDIALADMDGDGRLDIVVLVNDTGFIAPHAEADYGGTFVILFQGNDPRRPADWTQIPQAGRPPPANLSFPAKDSGPVDLVVDQFDNAGGPDIAVVSNEYDFRRVRLYSNPGGSAARDVSNWRPVTVELDTAELAQAASADVDADGDVDILLGVPEAKSFNLRWLANPTIRLVADDPNPVPTFIADDVDPQFEVTAGARATALGDINNDGYRDIVSISDESQPVQIHLRNPTSGKFDTISIAGGAPLARSVDVALADFNADNRLDIAVLVNETGYTPLLSWDEDKIGALVLLIQGPDARNPAHWTQVDFTRQTVADCFADITPPECGMMMPTGRIGPTDLDVDDFNNDGLPDVVCTDNRRDKAGVAKKYLHYFKNPGVARVTDAAWWRRQTIDSGIPAYSRIGVADIDGDGLPDVVAGVPAAVSFNLRWIRNIGGAVAWSQELIGQQEGGANVLALGDIDSDGDIDVAAASAERGVAQWFRNPGRNSLPPLGAQVPWEVFNIGTVPAGPIDQVHLVDLDNNGTLDCFVSAAGQGIGFRRQLDNLERAWTSFTIFVAEPAATIGQTTFFDFDNDGKIDLVAPFNREGVLDDRFVLYRSVAGSLWQRRLVGQQQGGGHALTVGDINGDGYIDVGAASRTLGLVQWFRNPGPSALLPTSPQVPWSVFNIGSLGSEGLDRIRFVDLDNNGSLDCFGTANGAGLGFRRRASLDTLWERFTLFSTDPVAAVGPAGFHDFDGDGKLDFVVPLNREGLLNDEFALYLSYSGSLWERRLVGQQEGGGDCLALGDIDGDGNVDVAAASVRDGLLQWFRNPGRSGLLPASPQVPWNVYNISRIASVTVNDLPLEGQINQVVLADMNADGRLDAFVTAGSTALEFLPGTNLTAPWRGYALFKADPPATIGPVGIGDFDLNGIPDIVAPIDREGLTRDKIILWKR